MGVSLMSALGLGGPGKGAGSPQFFYPDMGQVPMNEQPETINSNANPLQVQGQKRDEGEESYIEIKGPTGLGARSSLPYQNVLPKYKKQAEQALDRDQIPPEHRQRVRDYFDALQGTKK